MLKRKEFILGALAGLTLAAGATAGGIVTWPGAHADPQAVNRITPVPANGDSFSPPPGAPNSFANIFEQVAPAVVQIDVTVKVDQPQGGAFQIPGLPFQFVPPQGQGEDAEPRTTQGAGSGFFISQDGFIVTNNHVVADATEIKVKMSDGRELPARLVGRDEATDLAVIKVDGDNFKYVSFEETAQPRVGDWVIAIGNPFGLDWTLTNGIVSALDRSLPGESGGVTIEHLIQTDAAINPGNSGGPLLDSAGRLIGINTAIYSPSGASAGIGFAVPVDTVMRVMPQLIKTGKYIRPALGIEVDEQLNLRLQALTSTQGVFVLRVAPGSAAQKAGLSGITVGPEGIVPGDRITGIGGAPVDDVAKLLARLDDQKVGDVVVLSVERAGKPRELRVELQPGA